LADLAERLAAEAAGWEADHVAVATRSGDAEPTVVGDPARPFAIASITKLFTALATLVAVEEEALGLDDPAGPEGSTVRHLLAHASGLGFDTTTPLTRPGRRRIYSNPGYVALADAVADATSIDFTTYAIEAVLEPLGLTGTRPEGSPAAGWSSTAADVLTLIGQARDPTVVSPETMGLATSVAFPGLPGVLPDVGRFDPLDWGLGFEIRDEKRPHWTGSHNSPATVGHFGGRGTMAWYDPDADVALVALSDRAFGPWALEAWPQLADLVLATAALGG
jgi:CubicO group peptidase (beta-lactamase class C family)